MTKSPESTISVNRDSRPNRFVLAVGAGILGGIATLAVAGPPVFEALATSFVQHEGGITPDIAGQLGIHNDQPTTSLPSGAEQFKDGYYNPMSQLTDK